MLFYFLCWVFLKSFDKELFLPGICKAVLERKLPAWVSASELLTGWVSKMPRGLAIALFALGELLSHPRRPGERMKLRALQAFQHLQQQQCWLCARLLSSFLLFN